MCAEFLFNHSSMAASPPLLLNFSGTSRQIQPSENSGIHSGCCLSLRPSPAVCLSTSFSVVSYGKQTPSLTLWEKIWCGGCELLVDHPFLNLLHPLPVFSAEPCHTQMWTELRRGCGSQLAARCFSLKPNPVLISFFRVFSISCRFLFYLFFSSIFRLPEFMPTVYSSESQLSVLSIWYLTHNKLDYPNMKSWWLNLFLIISCSDIWVVLSPHRFPMSLRYLIFDRTYNILFLFR